MKLYYSPGACSLAPHIVANEAGISLELVRVDIKAHVTETGEDFYKINAKGYVPTLVLDDGSLLTEGPAVQLYVADLKPESGLAPAPGTFARYKQYEWLAFINSEIHANFEPLFAGATGAEKNDATAKLQTRFDYVSGALGTGDFLTGDNFTAADAYMFVMTTWAHHLKVDMPANFHDFFVRVSKRPAVHAAMKEEGLIK